MAASTCLRLLVGGVLLTLSVAAGAENAVTTDPASVRAGPDSSYPEVAQLDADTPIQVMGCLDDWSWCDVDFQGNRGWLYSPDITYEYQGGYVPFYAYAPALGVAVVAFSLDAYWGSHYHDRPWYGQRDQWIHRPIRHQRPSGPAPSRRPPPREVVRTERPHGGSQPSQPSHAGSSAPSHRDSERRDVPAGHADSRPPETRAPTHAPLPAHAPPPPAERTSKPPERAAPQHQEEHAHPTERAATPQRDEHRAAPEKPESPPHKEDEGDRPK